VSSPRRRTLLALLLASACRGERSPSARAPAAAARETPTITGEGIGLVRIGLPKDSLAAVARVVRDTIETDIEGNPQEVASVVIEGDTVRVEVSEGRVWRIRVAAPGLATADGVRVGAPVARLVTSGAVSGAAGEGKVYLLDPSRCGLSFGLSREAPLARAPLDSAALLRLPPSTHVDQILAVGCSRPDR
jgi:hypothetical protein